MLLPQPSLISLRAVSYAPEGRQVLSDVTLETNAKRIGIVGRNGSGKTSLARILSGLVPADSGVVQINGVDVAKDRKAALRNVGILFQNPDHQIIFPTVQEEVAFGLLQMGQSKSQAQDAVAQILNRFDKAHWASAAIHRLSQGQRQLVCLMSVLAMAPSVIVLDEPFAGLDIPTTRQLQRVLAELDATLVMITHDPNVVRAYDEVLWIDGGEIVDHGPPDHVLDAFEARMQQIGEEDDLTDLAG